jgi:endonuclease III
VKKIEVKEKLLSLSSYPQELGLEIEKPEDKFKWFLASILFSKRISSEIAKRTYRRFEAEGITTLEAIINAGWDKLVEILDAGGYVRYDFSTASNLLGIANELNQKYGSLENLYDQAKDSKDLEKKLTEFKGIGPTTVSIFLRELKLVWEKANPPISPLAKEVAARLGLEKEVLDDLSLESRLVKLNLEFCKRKRCSDCFVKEMCQQPRKY